MALAGFGHGQPMASCQPSLASSVSGVGDFWGVRAVHPCLSMHTKRSLGYDFSPPQHHINTPEFCTHASQFESELRPLTTRPRTLDPLLSCCSPVPHAIALCCAPGRAGPCDHAQ